MTIHITPRPYWGKKHNKSLQLNTSSLPTGIKIDGRKLSKDILRTLKPSIRKLKKKKIVPHLAVVLIGDNKESLSFVRQKKKSAKTIGVKVTIHHFKKTPDYQKLAESIIQLSNDRQVHGIIVQKPLPPSLSSISVDRRIKINKDVDGFRQKSLFDPPIGLAVEKIIKHIYFKYLVKGKAPNIDFPEHVVKWLKLQKILLVGRGETGGKPIAHILRKNRIPFIMSHSQTENIAEYMQDADIIISAVGKPNTINPNNVKEGCILIGIGIRKSKSKLTGDYNETKIKGLVSFYTPTPGGIGPINVSCLIENVVKAALLNNELT